MSKRKLSVKISSLEGALEEFQNVWEQAEHGEKLKTPIEILSFENASTLMKTLSPKRLTLLQAVHQIGKVSVRQLAKFLARDYKNVHQDVKALHHVGLVLCDSSNKYYVSWDTIVTEIPLCIGKSSRHHPHQHFSGSEHLAH